MADCPRGEDQHFDGICHVCGQHCQCKLYVQAIDLVWRDHQFGSGSSGYLSGVKFFGLEWGGMIKGEHEECPWHLTTTLPLKKEVTEKWWFKSREAAMDMAWRAASAWLSRATKIKEGR
jgi:hypothetical protein